jgi:hypothetical protein
MNRLTKTIGAIGLALTISFCVNTSVKAQTPDDDPGIGGPGSGGSSPGDDGGPVVPLDRDLSILLISVGIAYGYKKIVKQQNVVG